MLTQMLSLVRALWEKSGLIRYAFVHTVLGIGNFTLAFVMIYLFAVNHHLATAMGHFAHTAIGFFIDRRISFRAMDTRATVGIPTYWAIEGISYSSIVLTLVVFIDLGLMHTIIFAPSLDGTFDWLATVHPRLGSVRHIENLDFILARGVVAVTVSGIISFTLNKYLTFCFAERVIRFVQAKIRKTG